MVWGWWLLVLSLQYLEFFLVKMEEVVDGLLQKWSIEDAEDLTIVKIDDLDQLTLKRFWLVGRLLTSKPFCRDSLRSTMKRIWKTKGEISISEWGTGDRFMFSFRYEADRSRVLRGSPWSFDNALLLLAPTDGKADPSSIPLVSQSFWIRIWGLPPCLFSRPMGERIGGILGDFIDIDLDKNGDCTGKFLKIRVSLNVSKPLRRWVMLDTGLSEKTKLTLEYEDLPYFCFFCGRLSHVSSGCKLAKEGLIAEPQYGRWKTLSKNVYNIDPAGQLTGLSYGLQSKKPLWRMQAPEPSLSGHVRPRGALDSVEVSSEADMVLDNLVEVTVEESLQFNKRRRVALMKTDGALEDEPLGRETRDYPVWPNFETQGNAPGFPHARQGPECREGKFLGKNIAFGSTTEDGYVENSVDSVLNFQIPLGGVKKFLSVGSTTTGWPIPTQHKNLKGTSDHTHSKVNEACVSVLIGADSSGPFLDLPQPINCSPLPVTVPQPNVGSEKSLPLPVNSKLPIPSPSLETFLTTGSTAKTINHSLPPALPLDDSCLLIAELATSSIKSAHSSSRGGDGGLGATRDVPTASGNQMQVKTSPIHSRAKEKKVSGSMKKEKKGFLVHKTSVSSPTKISQLKSGRLSKRPSVMGPVLAHHEQ